MTPFPFFVDAADPVAKVERLMRKHKIRHVPVQRDGQVVGIVSERDLHRWSSQVTPDRNDSRVTAAEVMASDPYLATFDTPLSQVAAQMSRRRIGSALIVRHGKLAGILSAMDVCRILAAVLDAEFSQRNGNDAA
jgi:acetoin utilization protein AcuB